METGFGCGSVGRLLLRLAPPVMLSQLIQALYNIVDSYYVGRFSDGGLTALSLIFPVQLLMSAMGVGTGVGVSTLIARYHGEGRPGQAREIACTGTALSLLNWAVFAALALLLLPGYLAVSTASPEVRGQGLIYGRIVCAGSLGLFLESNWTKVLQGEGNMRLPMLAQIAGAGVNIVLDPLLIFGLGPLPELGIAGAALSSVAGQAVAAGLTGAAGWRGMPRWGGARRGAALIYRTGLPSIVMQALYTVYIVGLNLILARFCDEAVTVLGLYYKLQTFFFIPLLALEGCVVPPLSYNYAADAPGRCRRILTLSMAWAAGFMLVGTALFELLPVQLLMIFTDNTAVLEIGPTALRIIAVSFVPAVPTCLFPACFQAVGEGKKSLFITVLRQVLLLVPVAWVLSFAGLDSVWLTFPISETIAAVWSTALYWRSDKARQREAGEALQKTEKF